MRLPVRHLAALCLVAAAASATPQMRREFDVRFPLDEGFLADGGVQFFYELARKDPSPEAASATFGLFQGLDESGRWRTDEPLHVVMSRIVYDVDKPVGFWTATRAVDLAYLNAVAPQYRIARQPDGGFRSGATPSNAFTVRFLDEAAVRQAAGRGAVARLLGILAAPGLPESIAFQQNDDFARVLGMRTAELSVTWTAHFPLGPGRTRLQVLTMSYLHSIPPFFLGGERRVYRESITGAATLIDALRRYREPAP